MIKCYLKSLQKGVSLLKCLGRLGVVPLKLQDPNLERGLALGQLGSSQIKSFKPTLGVGPRKPTSQLGADLAFNHVIQL